MHFFSASEGSNIHIILQNPSDSFDSRMHIERRFGLISLTICRMKQNVKQPHGQKQKQVVKESNLLNDHGHQKMSIDKNFELV